MAAVTFTGKGPLMAPAPVAAGDGPHAASVAFAADVAGQAAGASVGASSQSGRSGRGGRASGISGDGGREPSMRRSIFRSFFLLSTVLLAAVVFASSLLMQKLVVESAANDLMHECETLAGALNLGDDPEDLAERMEYAGARVTLLAADGSVVFDNLEEASTMGSHADRPEVQQALEEGEGSAVRSSDTLSEVLVYGAVRLDSGQILRLSVTRDSVLGVLADLTPVMAAAMVIILLMCAGLSRWLSHRLVAPLDALDPAAPLAARDGAYCEIVPLLERMDEQNRQIAEQVGRLSDNDRMRVEFTANVTHELKTPLTSISGYAELIETGLAAPQDVPEFARRIREESLHLASLVNDILTLSKMDEAEKTDGVLGACEPVDLTLTASSVVDRLASRAADADVSLKLVCESDEALLALGMPKLVDQIVFNLCDNAIRYNRPQGTVTVRCGKSRDGRPFVSVADTGIGIAPENLQNVFARFYRVDPSRSRETGGTGLGLAIVKHAARCHDALLDISSELGAGTCITVTFHGADDSAWTQRG